MTSSDQPTDLPDPSNSGDLPRLDYVQGIRGFSASVVVATHAGIPFAGGFVTMDVFFVLSGFVIARLLLHERQRTGRISLRTFYKRRVARLLPALVVCVIVTLIASAVLLSPLGPQRVAAITGLASIFSVANLVLPFISGGYFQFEADQNVFLHMWSLSVEEQFYAVFPWLLTLGLAVGATHGRRVRNAKVLIGCLGLLSFIACLAMAYVASQGTSLAASMHNITYYSSVSRAWEFAAGGLLALWWHRIERVSPRVLLSVATTALLAYVVLFFAYDTTMVFPSALALLPVAIGVALIAVGAAGDTWVRRLFELRPFVWAGDRSYSWYLWHWPIIVIATALLPGRWWIPPLAALASIWVAKISYDHVERRYRARSIVDPLGRRTSAWTWRSLGTLALVGAITAGIIFGGTRSQWGVPAAQAMDSQVTPLHLDSRIGCSSDVPLAQRARTDCMLSHGGRAKVYLLGDSTAGQLSDVLAQTTKSAGVDLLLGARSACPFMDVNVVSDGMEMTECRTYVRSALSWLSEQPPGTVVLSLGGTTFLNGEKYAFEGHDGKTAQSQSKRLEAYAAGLADTFANLRADGHRVIFVQPALRFNYPHGDPWLAQSCPLARIAIDAPSCGLTIDRRVMLAERQPAIDAFNLVPEADRPESIDLVDQLCRKSECSTYRDGHWIYRDASHLSVPASMTLAPLFTSLLTSSTKDSP
ncbi:peptidoglycan/LPS O-acetylase OafA/YrhL [Aeromicrobium panaciterrae]|uniref:Peptidoglycan/LPS O-acetylase OafA/YrhL n=1 Tax=Aeromicrobium panaciterrae TaxID=363861 RepID=A0ABU1UL53_9ACTN|nr:acyltransferase family protein [Aeromicrobium panaciterrae]MDR7085922.1 peptidoglycan/LPS O-acetylase OafA/YrhL [Aeromicrobium panaciterrae]